MKTVEIKKDEQVVTGAVVCPTHGLLPNELVQVFNYVKKDKDGVMTVENNYYCMACLDEYYQKLQKEGKLQKVIIVPITEQNNKN